MSQGSPIIQMVTRFMVPFIQLFGLYVYVHGEVSPGGGFQAGVIIAASFVLLAMVYGWRYGRDQISEKVQDMLAPTGALIYGLVGLGTLLLGGKYLEYNRYATGTDPEAIFHAHSLGLTGIELGVTVTVTFAMLTLYFEMSHVDDKDADGLADNYPAQRPDREGGDA